LNPKEKEKVLGDFIYEMNDVKIYQIKIYRMLLFL